MSTVNIYNFTVGNQVFLYTNYDVDIVSSGLTYKAIRITRGNILSTASDDKAPVNVSMSKDQEIVNFFRKGLPYSTITVSISLIEDTDNPDVVIPLFYGEVSGCERELNIATLSCEPLSILLKTRMTRRTFQSKCNNFLYRGGCKLNILDYRFEATVLDIKNNGRTLVVDKIIKDGGDPVIYKLKTGIVTKDLENKMIISVNETLKEINLLTRMTTVNVGDVVFLSPGCDRTSARCKEFNNFDNFDGFEFVPNRNKFLAS